MMNYYDQLAVRAKKVIPGGVNSSIRSYPEGFVPSAAQGAHFWDQNGKQYVDYFGAAGPMVLGYNNREVNRKVVNAIHEYELYGVGITEPEVELAEKLCAHVKGAEKALACNGGSDATYNAIRMARAYTKREKIIKMQGAFHGWHDFVLMNVLSKPEKLYQYDPGSSGMVKDVVEKTVLCRINDLEDLKEKCQQNKGEIAAVILDPGFTVFGCMYADPDYIRGVRKLCDEEGIVLIFDEVVTGFRVGLKGGGALFDVTPDLVTLGKAMANGFPIAALAGKAEIMDKFNTTPEGKVGFQATYYGHPVMSTAAVATIAELEKPGVYEHLARMGDMLCEGLNEAAQRAGVPFSTQNIGSLIGLYFGEGEYHNADDVAAQYNAEASVKFRKSMVEKGFYFYPGPYSRVVVSYAVEKEDIARTLQAAEDSFKLIK